MLKQRLLMKRSLSFPIIPVPKLRYKKWELRTGGWFSLTSTILTPSLISKRALWAPSRTGVNSQSQETNQWQTWPTRSEHTRDLEAHRTKYLEKHQVSKIVHLRGVTTTRVITVVVRNQKIITWPIEEVSIFHRRAVYRKWPKWEVDYEIMVVL